jgi:serine phosphatase RsbU (regulator of sigma subunit)
MDAVLVSERASVEVFATVSMARIDMRANVAQFWLAGHPMPAVIEGHDVRPVPEHAAGVALGVVDEARWSSTVVELQPTSVVMMFTDGLIEGHAAVGARGRLGEPAMHALMTQLLEQGLGRSALADAILREVRQRNGGELTDDVALLLLSWTPDA